MWTGVHFAPEKEPLSVIVISDNDVERLAAVILPYAFASTSVPLGEPALSVSIRTHKFTLGEETFARASFNVFQAVQDKKAGNETRVFHDTSPIFCALVASANVATGSANTACQAFHVSHQTRVLSDVGISITATGTFPLQSNRKHFPAQLVQVSSLSTNLLLALGAVPDVQARALYLSSSVISATGTPAGATLERTSQALLVVAFHGVVHVSLLSHCAVDRL